MANDVVDVLMPLMGEGVNEATLVRWLKRAGESIGKDEPIVEVSTDKVDTEIPSPSAGTIVETLANEGDTITVNALLARISKSGATTAPSMQKSTIKVSTPLADRADSSSTVMTAASSDSEFASKSSVLQHGTSQNVKSSPLVRKMAREQGVDLGALTGSGLHGRITKRDLLQHMETGPSSPPVGTPSSLQTRAHAPEISRVRTEIADGRELLDGVPVRREKMSKIRRLTAEHMVGSVRTSPHVTTVFEIDLQKVVAIREKYMGEFQAREGFKLTYTPFFIHAAVQAIKAHPMVNVSVDGDDILYKDKINLGCAVAIETGLIVPVIKDAGELSLLGITRRLNELVTRARTKNLKPDDVRGGTFTITNPGGYGSLTSNPIINQPQVAILGIGAVVKRPVVVDEDRITIRPMMMVSLTFDHRVVDGEGGAKYLATLKNLLENYQELPR